MGFEDMCNRITDFLNGPPLKSERIRSEPIDSLREIAAELGRPSVKVYRILLPRGTHSVGFPRIARKFYPGEVVACLAHHGFVLYPRSRADRARAAKRARHAARPNGRRNR